MPESLHIESLIAKLHSNKPFLSVEVSVPLSASIGALLDSMREVAGIADCFVCTDSPLARLKPSSILSALKMQNALQKPVIATLSMRDRNSIALCGEILAANELDVRAFLTLTGDALQNGDCAESRGVFEKNSLLLARIIEGLNNGVAFNGKTLHCPVARIYNFQVINAYANNPQSLATKMRKKLENARVEAFFTQPVYSVESAAFLLENLAALNAELGANTELVLGFFPVLSLKVALFLRDKLPGVFIPNEWIQELESANKKGADYEREMGLQLSRDLLADLQKLHRKFHFMSSNKLGLVREFLS